MHGGEALALGWWHGAFEPIEHGDLQVGDAAPRIERQERSTVLQRDQLNAREVLKELGPHDDERAAPGKLHELSWRAFSSLMRLPVARAFEQLHDRPRRVRVDALQPRHHIVRKGERHELGGTTELERPSTPRRRTNGRLVCLHGAKIIRTKMLVFALVCKKSLEPQNRLFERNPGEPRERDGWHHGEDPEEDLRRQR